MIELLKIFAYTGGEWVIYLLLICSVLALAVMIERGILLMKEKKELENVKPILKKNISASDFQRLAGELENLVGSGAKVVSAGLRQHGKGPEAIEESMNLASAQERNRLEKHLLLLGTLGSNAVYIGLFGTVLGVIRAFRDLAEQVGAGPEVVMQGLSEALIATAVGLMVAVPSVIAYNIFQKIIKDLISEAENMARMILTDHGK